jgi:hypothetical protein
MTPYILRPGDLPSTNAGSGWLTKTPGTGAGRYWDRVMLAVNDTR